MDPGLGVLVFRPLTQTIMAAPEKGIHGNCFATCVAAITGEDNVPNFAQEGKSKWFIALWTWADRLGWDVCSPNENRLPEGVLVAMGLGPRGFKHAVLWAGGRDGMIIWDPHPDRTGLVGRPENWVSIDRDLRKRGADLWTV